MDNLLILINGSMVFVTLWIVYKYLNTFFKRKEKTSIISIIIWIIFYIYQMMVEFEKGSGSLIILLINIIIIFAICVTGYQGILRNKLFYSILLYVVWLLIEMITFFILNQFKIDNSTSNLIGSFTSKLAVIILVFILSNNINKKHSIRMPIGYLIMIITIPVSSMYIAYNIYVLDYNHSNFTIISYIILLTANCIILEVYERLLIGLRLEKENAVYEQQLEFIVRQSEEQEKAMKDFLKEQHDLKNQLIGLKNHINNNQGEKALIMINDLLDECTINLKGISNSGNDIIDALINYKYSFARKNNIGFSVKTFIPSELPIRHKDMCAVLGNALDNAMEAVEKCNLNRNIDITIGLKKKSFIIVIKNPFKGEVIANGQGKLITTKENPKKHGYGLESIKKAIERYQGELITEVNSDIFILTVIMNV